MAMPQAPELTESTATHETASLENLSPGPAAPGPLGQGQGCHVEAGTDASPPGQEPDCAVQVGREPSLMRDGTHSTAQLLRPAFEEQNIWL